MESMNGMISGTTLMEIKTAIGTETLAADMRMER